MRSAAASKRGHLFRVAREEALKDGGSLVSALHEHAHTYILQARADFEGKRAKGLPFKRKETEDTVILDKSDTKCQSPFCSHTS